MISLKKYVHHFIAIGIFIVIGCVYFSPALSGKKVEMYDMANSAGQSKEVVDFHKKTGVDPLWTGSMFSGMPTFQILTFSKENFMVQIFSFFTGIFAVPIFLLLLNLVGFYILLIVLKVDYRLAIAGAIMYAFCSYTFIFIKVGHITKTMAIGCMPLALAGIIRTLKGNLLSGFVLTIMGLWMEIYSNHFQITYYLMMVVAVFMLIELYNSFREKKITAYFKSCAVLLVAGFIALLPNLTNLWSTYEYGKQTTRGASELSAKQASTGLDIDYATDWSYGVGETLTLLIADARGGGSSSELSKSSATYEALVSNGAGGQAASYIKNAPTYWGDQTFTAGPDYIGAITVFLFVLGLFVVRGDMKWWLLSVTILSILLAWGHNFMGFTEIFFYHVPGYNKFRSVNMILTIATLAMPILAILAVKRIAESTKDELAAMQKKLKYAFYCVGGFCLVLFLMPSIGGDFTSKSDEHMKQYEWLLTALRQDRESMLRMGALMSLLYTSIAFVSIWFFLKKKIKVVYLYYILIFFVLVDMWTVDKRYMNDDHFVSKGKSEKPFEPSSADLQILQDPNPSFRVLNTTVNPFSDASTSYFHKSIGGYHGAKLKRYQELIEFQLSKSNMNVLNMLNTKYMIARVKDAPEPIAQLNPAALGNAWFVNEIKWVPNADSELNALTDFNPAQTAIIDKRFEKDLGNFNFTRDTAASIKLLSYAPNALVYESNCTAKQLTVFSEIYYADGWNAYVDGNKSSYIRVNYVLRGMIVPEGKHKIEFKFEPEYYYKTQTASTAGSVIALLILLGYIVYSFRNKSDTPVT